MKKPAAKEASTNNAAPSNVNDDDYDSLSGSTPVPTALKQHRTRNNIPPKKTLQSPKTPHFKSPTRCQVSTRPRSAIVSKLQARAISNALRLFADSEPENEAATRFLGGRAGDMMAIRGNGGVETGEVDEIADYAAYKVSAQPVMENWPVVMGNGAAHRIRQKKKLQKEHNCGLKGRATLGLLV